MTREQMNTANAEYRYVTRWFWTFDQLARASGCDPVQARALITANCAPGAIYAVTEAGDWWSALRPELGSAPDRTAANDRTWFSPGAAWCLRTGRLLVRRGANHAEAANRMRQLFIDDFVAALSRTRFASAAFPECFASDGTVIAAQATIRAKSEWSDWIDGGYGVCLRVFTAETCIAKESLAARLKACLSGDETADDLELIGLAEALAGLILPFSPWERPSGTPGVTIDRLLASRSLGLELPFEE